VLKPFSLAAMHREVRALLDAAAAREPVGEAA